MILRNLQKIRNISIVWCEQSQCTAVRININVNGCIYRKKMIKVSRWRERKRVCIPPLSPRERSSRQGSCRVGAGRCWETPELLVACSGKSNRTECDPLTRRTKRKSCTQQQWVWKRIWLSHSHSSGGRREALWWHMHCGCYQQHVWRAGKQIEVMQHEETMRLWLSQPALTQTRTSWKVTCSKCTTEDETHGRTLKTLQKNMLCVESNSLLYI